MGFSTSSHFLGEKKKKKNNPENKCNSVIGNAWGFKDTGMKNLAE